MLRTATRPRHLALLALVLALATVFAWLGDWQLQRSRVEAAAGAAQAARAGQPAADLTSVLAPATPVTGAVVGRTVTVTGRFDAADELLVDASGATWVLTPLLVPTAAGEARLPVVRGATAAGAQPEDVPPPPAGTVTLTGRLEAGSAPTGLAPGAEVDRVAAVSPADLANVWGTPLWTAYLAVTDPVPPAPLTALPEPDRGGGLELRNLSYALQWWVFALFALFVWWRVVVEAHRRETHLPGPGPGLDPGTDPGLDPGPEPGPEPGPGSRHGFRPGPTAATARPPHAPPRTAGEDVPVSSRNPPGTRPDATRPAGSDPGARR